MMQQVTTTTASLGQQIQIGFLIQDGFQNITIQAISSNTLVLPINNIQIFPAIGPLGSRTMTLTGNHTGVTNITLIATDSAQQTASMNFTLLITGRIGRCYGCC